MEAYINSLLPVSLLENIGAMPLGELTLPMLLAAVTASLVALSIPGAVNTMSFLSGLVLGLGGVFVAALGVLLGSHVLFLATRKWLGPRMKRKFGERLDKVHEHLERRGPIYVVGARLGAVPHLVVTAGCAAAPISARSFLGASMLGMAPSIVLSALAGAAIFSF